MEWNSRFSVGVNNLDNQHLRIMTIINDMHLAIQLKLPRGSIKALLTELIACIRVHTSFEEQLLKSVDYPAYEEHVKLHDDLRSRLKTLSYVALDENEPELVLIFLREWWNEHILKEDMKYVPHVQNALK